MVCCALTVTAFVVRRELHTPASPSVAVTQESDWRSYASDGHHIGAVGATVTIVEFGDFECPACSILHRHLESVFKSDSSVQLLFRHYPLRSHRFALPAVRISECADEQGRFAQMYDVLFDAHDSLGLSPWSVLGQRAGVDTVALMRCFRSASPSPALARDTVAGNRLGISGTPLLLINQFRVDGVPPLDSLKSIIERARKTALIRPGVSSTDASVGIGSRKGFASVTQ